MRYRDLGCVLDEIGKSVAELQKSLGDEWQGKEGGFQLWLSNNVRVARPAWTERFRLPGFATPPTASFWAFGVGRIDSYAPTAEEGLRELLAELYSRLGKPERPPEASVEAIGELMQELARIGAAMSPPGIKPEVSRDEGPCFDLSFDSRDTGRPRVRLSFDNLAVRYICRRHWEALPVDLRCECSDKTLLDALEEVIAQACYHYYYYGRRWYPFLEFLRGLFRPRIGT